MTCVKICGLVLALGVSVGPFLSGGQEKSAPGAASTQPGTLVLKIETAGLVSIDGRPSVAVRAGQIINFPLQPGQHLVSLKTKDGNTVEKMVTAAANESGVETIGSSSGSRETSAPSGSAPKSANSAKLQKSNGTVVDSLDFDKNDPGDVRIEALLLLGLWTAELDEAKRSNTIQAKSAVKTLPDSINGSRAQADHGYSCALLNIGQQQRALLRANESISEHEKWLKNGTSTDDLGQITKSLGDDQMCRAAALFATGDLQGAIASVHEAQAFISKAISDKSEGAPRDLDRSFEQLAAMYALMGNWQGCLEALGEASKEDVYSRQWWSATYPNRPENEGPSLLGYCSRLAAKEVAGTSGSTTASGSSASSIQNQINDVLKSGKYSALPVSQANPGSGSGLPTVQIENDTRYNLTVLCAGPSQRSIQIGPGQSSSLDLPAGSYQVLGRVDAPNVVPTYGQRQFQSGSIYTLDFYIAAR